MQQQVRKETRMTDLILSQILLSCFSSCDVTHHLMQDISEGLKEMGVNGVKGYIVSLVHLSSFAVDIIIISRMRPTHANKVSCSSNTLSSSRIGENARLRV